MVLGNSNIHWPAVGFQKTPHQTFWQRLSTLPELIDTIRGNNDAIDCIAANLDDWDAYESRKWRAIQAWKARHHDNHEYADFCRMGANMRHEYLAKHSRTSARRLLPPSTNSGVECFVLGDDAFPAKHIGECLAAARES